MARFLFLLRNSQPLPFNAEMPLMGHGINGLTQWMSELALSGNYLWGEALSRNCSYVENERTSKKIVMADSVVGCFLIRAENVDQASAIAQDCPAVLMGTMDIEVRPVIDVPYD